MSKENALFNVSQSKAENFLIQSGVPAKVVERELNENNGMCYGSYRILYFIRKADGAYNIGW
jgi:hypothetical protein